MHFPPDPAWFVRRFVRFSGDLFAFAMSDLASFARPPFYSSCPLGQLSIPWGEVAESVTPPADSEHARGQPRLAPVFRVLDNERQGRIAKIHSIMFTTFTISGNTATFSGTCTNNGAPCTFSVMVQDNGEPSAAR
jgi:hypothetical protein